MAPDCNSLFTYYLLLLTYLLHESSGLFYNASTSYYTELDSEDDVAVIPRLIVDPPVRSHALRGQTFVLSCQAVGAPTPRVTWYKDSLPLVGRRGRITAFESGYLIIADTQLSDEGRYRCEASNRVGNISGITTVIVTQHESGCADGITDGLHQYEYIQACSGSWRGHVKKGGRQLCRSGWQVCSPRHVSYLKMITWSDVTNQLDGCFGYNAANTLNLCTPCVNGNMAGVGSGCSRSVSTERSCLAEGRIDVYNQHSVRIHKHKEKIKDKNKKKYKNTDNDKNRKKDKMKDIRKQTNKERENEENSRNLSEGCHYTESVTTGVLCCRKPESWQIGYNWKAPRCRPNCRNDGVCISNNVCRCPAGYKGTVCQNPVCPSGCIPNSVCIKPGVCRCLEGYSGPKCRGKNTNLTERNKGPALMGPKDSSCPRPCLFGGQCRDGECKCPAFRRGRFCQKDKKNKTRMDKEPNSINYTGGMMDVKS